VARAACTVLELKLWGGRRQGAAEEGVGEVLRGRGGYGSGLTSEDYGFRL